MWSTRGTWRLICLVVLIFALSPGALAKQTLTLGTWVGPGAGTWNTLESIVAGFNSSQSDVEVEIVSVSGFDEAIAVQIASGIGPDLIHAQRQLAWKVRDGLIDLNPLFERSHLDASSYFPGLIDSASLMGRLWYLPIHTGSTIMFFNRDMFAEAAVHDPMTLYQQGNWTWESALEAARKLTRDSDGDGVAEVWGISQRLDWHFGTHARQNGGAFISADGRQYLGDRIEFTEAVQWLADLALRHGVMSSTFAHIPEVWDGKSAMGPYSANGRSWFRTNGQDINWEVAPYYNQPVGRPFVGVGGNGFAINGNSQNVDAAWQFIEYALSLEGQLIFAGTGGDVPAHIEAARSREFTSEPGVENFAQTMNAMVTQVGTFPPKYVPDDGRLENLQSQAIQAVASGEKSAVVAFQEIAGAVQAILDELQDFIVEK